MNPRFFDLPEARQQDILRAGYRVFANNSYKHSPMSEIAAEAGVSKSLLFHYFRNKRELYLYLWQHCAKITVEAMTRHGCYGQKDLFDSMERGMEAKLEVLARWPDMGNFTVRAFYETDAEIAPAIRESYRYFFSKKADKTLTALDPGQFVPGLDLNMMYREMYWASEGYLWEAVQKGNLDLEVLQRDFKKLLEFWKSIYLRKE